MVDDVEGVVDVAEDGVTSVVIPEMIIKISEEV